MAGISPAMTRFCYARTATDIVDPERYINVARHVRAFCVCIGMVDDGIDTIERRP